MNEAELGKDGRAPLELNYLLERVDIDPATTMVMRHRPTQKLLRKALPLLAAADEPTYNSYQRIQGLRVQESLKKRSHLVSLIGHRPGRALFVGIYSVNGVTSMSHDEFYASRENQLLRSLGSRGPEPGRYTEWFDLRRTELLGEWSGRLVVRWPGLEKSWWRIAANNVIPVDAIHEESALTREVPDPQTMTLTWQELQILPTSWQQAFAQWRGIYLIYDTELDKAYVGSAYGADNMLSRWTNYAKTGHGGNKYLRARDPETFVFSILQRVSPDMASAEVIALESSWKDRLHTRFPRGLNDN
jgi:hypothetical protein